MATSAPTPSVDIGTLITRTPDVTSGRPCIAGTSVSVMRIAGWYKLGWIPEEIARRVGLTLAQVHAALTYYHANEAEIEAELAEEQSLYEEYAQAYREKHVEESSENSSLH